MLQYSCLAPKKLMYNLQSTNYDLRFTIYDSCHCEGLFRSNPSLDLGIMSHQPSAISQLLSSSFVIFTDCTILVIPPWLVLQIILPTNFGWISLNLFKHSDISLRISLSSVIADSITMSFMPWNIFDFVRVSIFDLRFTMWHRHSCLCYISCEKHTGRNACATLSAMSYELWAIYSIPNGSSACFAISCIWRGISELCFVFTTIPSIP